MILSWADGHRERTGRWPTADSGAVVEAPGEVWAGVVEALHAGNRGLPGGNSLAKLLAAKRGARNRSALLALSEAVILEWARAHYAATGRWPNVNTGEVVDAPGERWAAVDTALRDGVRGLPGGSSLARLLKR